MSPRKRVSGKRKRKAAQLLLAVTSHRRLMKRYGEDGLEAIQTSLGCYKESLSQRGVELVVAFLDEKTSMSAIGLGPLKSVTASSVKTLLDRVIEKLSSKSKAHVSLLILGGGEVIPYCALSNPAYDSDNVVLSDNPYGSPKETVSSEKCLLPERPVGRMPDGDGTDLGVLLTQIETASESQGTTQKKELRARDASSSVMSRPFGYTAAIWKKASQNVWDDLGWEGKLKVSPPFTEAHVKPSWFENRRFLYFNLHGSHTKPYWFGQKGNDFPHALSPANVESSAPGRRIVLTEACYGAIEVGKSKVNSIALSFLSMGSPCLIGSTTIAYGALIPPVSEADVIALYFFQNVQSGTTFGDALVKARAQFAARAVSRQGYLDEDDKKTLLQFTLFGDPTGRVHE